MKMYMAMLSIYLYCFLLFSMVQLLFFCCRNFNTWIKGFVFKINLKENNTDKQSPPDVKHN